MTMALFMGSLLTTLGLRLILAAIATGMPTTMTTGVGAFLLTFGVFRTFADAFG